MEWDYPAVNINELIRELLALKASNEDLARRIERLERKVEDLANAKQGRSGIRKL